MTYITCTTRDQHILDVRVHSAPSEIQMRHRLQSIKCALPKTSYLQSRKEFLAMVCPLGRPLGTDWDCKSGPQRILVKHPDCFEGVTVEVLAHQRELAN